MLYGILVATDFSQRAARAEERAAMLGAELKCRTLELLAVNEPAMVEIVADLLDCSHPAATEALAGRALRQLQRISDRLQDRYRVRCVSAVRLGQPAAEIIAQGEEKWADLTVIGDRGSESLADLLLGSTADRLVRMGKRPFLIVKKDVEGPYRHVLVPVDFSEDSVRAAKMALQVAPKAQITFLHAYHAGQERHMREAGVAQERVDDYREKAGEQARQQLNHFIEELGGRSQLLSRAVKFGFPVPVICEHIDSMKPDLVVIGKHGQSALAELLLGSVTRSVLNRAQCDVLVATTARSSGDWYERPAA